MPRIRKLLKWALRLGLLLLVVFGLYVALLTFPSPLFAHAESFGSYRVYSDEAITDEIEQAVMDLDWRLAGMEHPPPEASQRIYLCGPGKFSFFAFLTRKNPRGLAIGLSMPNISFVSLERVRLFAEANGGALQHTRFEGNLAEVVAHEIAHFNSVRVLGLRVHSALPLWKSEGWAEYQANRSAIRADPDYDLAHRVDQLFDERYWRDRQGMARFFWESQLLVEYLGEIEGYGLRELAKAEVDEFSTRERMMHWYRQTQEPG